MPVLPYLAVGLGLFGFQNAWAGLLGFHAALLLAILLVRTRPSLSILFKSHNVRWVLLSILFSAGGGLFLQLFWAFLGITGDFSAYIHSLGLNPSNWLAFIAYFTLVNPLLEEYFWRGVLGSPTPRPYASDFLYAGFHALILIRTMPVGTVVFGMTVLVLAGWFWRQLAREDQGLLAPMLGHMAADFVILVVIYRMSL